MSEIDNIINVQITATAATPTVANFGTPAIYAYHSHNLDLIRTYTDLAGMVSDGFSTTEPAYLIAATIIAQNPRPPSFKVIRATAATSQQITFKVTNTTATAVVGFTLVNASGVATVVNHTVGSETATQIATALAAISVTGATLTSSTDTVTVAVTATTAIWHWNTVLGGNIADATGLASTHPAADLTAAQVVDNDWYGLTISMLSATVIADVAAWVETAKKIFAYTTSDTIAKASSSGVFYTLKAAAYTRSYGQYSATAITYGAAALMSQRLTADPGSDTWAFKTLAGVTVDTLTSTEITNIITNNGNFYTAVDGVNIALNGINASGLYMDIIRGVDAVAADIQARIYILLLTNPKIPYTRKGIAAIVAEVRASLLSFTRSKFGDIAFLSNESGYEPVVAGPKLEDVSPTDKQTRVLKNVTFIAYAQGAIQSVQVSGVVVI